MLKTLTQAPDGLVVMLGLSDLNAEALLQDRPIAFEGHEVGLPKYIFLIAYRHADGRMASPKRLMGKANVIVVPCEEAFLQPGCCDAYSADAPGFKVLTFRAKDEQAMYEMCKGGTTQETNCKVSGFAPGQSRVMGDN